MSGKNRNIYSLCNKQLALLDVRHCDECIKDQKVFCPRDTDGTCDHCGKSLCAYHLIEHWRKVHCIALDNEHCSKA
ncbi:MAG: hypothetical protein SCARUB_01282 [Candidatus Scalindua rubra]|uniref:Uncharacterized protein n=1 Tax=Candidatus Scalindua rubra TaxID=1872076 RepID=A0A1E3XD75_9BACT|nr:MAG: hypothetical protein SCARUB_01282 [Candidatus Scalindua rubra]